MQDTISQVKISDIETWAAEMREGDMAEARLLIISWSAFPGRNGERIDIGARPWGMVSPGWLAQIHRTAAKSYREWREAGAKPLDMFDAPEPTQKPAKRDTRPRRGDKKPYDESAVAGKEMPDDGEYNHPDDLPF